MQEHEIFFLSSNSTSLNFTGGELKVKETDTSSGYGIRVLDDGKVGFAYCQNNSEIKNTIAAAKDSAIFSPKSNFSFAPKASFMKLDIYDQLLDHNDYGMLRDFLEQAREGAESLGGRSRVSVGASESLLKIENTNGFFGEYKKTDFSLYVECMYESGFGYSYISSNKKPSAVGELGFFAAKMAKDMQEAKKPEPGKYDVVVEIESLESILGVLLPSFSGDWKRRGISKIENGKKYFSDNLTITENGLAPASNAQPFDDEGTPSKELSIVKNGCASSFLYDRETAALAGVDGSGVCSRDSSDDPPSIGSSNILVSQGNWNDLGELDKYIDLYYAHGSHTANPITGDIGLEVSGAFLVERNKRTPIKGFMITGNVFDWFAHIKGIEKKQKTLGNLIAPRIAFENVQIVA